MRSAAWRLLRLLILAGLSGCLRLLGVVVIGPGGPDRNTTEPIGSLAGSGWQWTGQFNFFCGVPVGPSSFLTAGHFGGNVGDRFTYQGKSYRTVGFEADSSSDLRLWHVSGVFPTTATVATEDLQLGELVVIIGRGAPKGSEILADRGEGPALAGWNWGNLDGRQRWGTNAIAQRLDGSAVGLFGPLVRCSFDGGIGDDEACISGGDSGGPMFVRRGQTWHLAAIQFGVEAAFNTTATGPGANGLIFDFRGLYRGSEGNWQLEAFEASNPVPTSFVSTRIMPRRAWLDAGLAKAPAPPTLQDAPAPEGPFTNTESATLDPVSRTFRVPRTEDARFFRLHGTAGLVITHVQGEANHLVLEYD